MARTNLRGAVWTVLLIGLAASAEATPIQYYFQGNFGVTYGSPPEEFGPVEPFWGSFFTDSLAADLNPNAFQGRFLISGPFTLQIGSYTSTASQTEVIQDEGTRTQLDLFAGARNMTTDLPGAPLGYGFMEFFAIGDGDVMNSAAELWQPLQVIFSFSDAAGNGVWRFGGNLTSRVNVPEPMTFALLASGIAIAGIGKARRRKS